MHVLLIEPDTSLADVYTQALRVADCTIAWSRTADNAIQVADHQKPDVVVLELQLAQHSGVAFLQEFRSYADWADVPVILHTLIPLAQLQSFESALKEMGVCSRLYKPQTTLEKLVQEVKRCHTVTAS